MVDQPVVPNFNVHTQVFMRVNLLTPQNELQGFIYSCIFPLGGCCELFLTSNSDLYRSAQANVQVRLLLS